MVDRRLLVQGLVYAAFAGAVAGFSAWPPYRPLPDGEALVRLSMSVSGSLVGDCRIVTAPELSRLPPNMRSTEVCPRERAPVRFELAIDGHTRVDETVGPRGVARDGAAVIYRRIPVTAGVHRIAVRVDPDAHRPGAVHEMERMLTLAPGALLTIDFDRNRGGVVLQ